MKEYGLAGILMYVMGELRNFVFLSFFCKVLADTIEEEEEVGLKLNRGCGPKGGRGASGDGKSNSDSRLSLRRPLTEVVDAKSTTMKRTKIVPDEGA